MEKVVILLNPSSGRGRSIRRKRKIEKIFRAKGIPYDLFVSESEGDLRKMSVEVMYQYKDIIAVGGDTTFNIIASEIMNQKNPVYPLPRLGLIGTGSANDICRALGINRTEVLCDCILQAHTRKMDVGTIRFDGNRRNMIFLGSMSAGLGTAVNRYIEKFGEKHKYLFRYNLSGQVLAGGLGIVNAFSKNLVPMSLTLTHNGYEQTISFSLLVFLNTNYYANGLNLNPGASAFDGQIDCLAINTTSPLTTFQFKRWVKKGTHLKKKEIQKIRSDRFSISSTDKFDIQLDGEIITNLDNCDISVLPNALDVYVPG